MSENNNENKSRAFDKLFEKIHNETCGDGYRNNQHTLCKRYNDDIKNLINKGEVPQQYHVDVYIEFLLKTSRHSYYYNVECCMVSKFMELKESIEWMISFHCPSTKNLVEIIKKGQIGVIQFVVNNKYPLRSSLMIDGLNEAIKVVQSRNYYQNYRYNKVADHKSSPILELLSTYEYIELNTDVLNKAIESGSLPIVTNILSRKIQTNDASLRFAIYSGSIDVVKLVIQHATTSVTIENLEYACEKKNVEIIKLLIEMKLIPNKKCFTNLLHKKEYNKMPKYEQSSQNHKDLIEAVKYLIASGYKPDLDDIVLATRSYVKIENIESFNIELDEKYLDACVEVGFYPGYKVKDNIKHSVSGLEKACEKAGNLDNIKKLVNESKITPNAKCLVNACKHKNNVQTIKFLLDKKAPVTIDAIKVIANVIGNRSLSTVLEVYIKQNKLQLDTENQQDEQSIDTNSDDIEIDDEVDDIKVEKEDNINNGVVDAVNVVNAVDAVNSDNVADAVDTVIKETQDTTNETKVKIGSKKRTGKIIVIKNKKNIDETKPEIKPETITESTNQTETTQQNNHINKYVMAPIKEPSKVVKAHDSIEVGTTLQKVLNIKKGTKLTYSDLKKALIMFATKNTLFDANNKTLIRINKDLSSLIGCDEKQYENQYFDFTQVDKVVSNIFLTNP